MHLGYARLQVHAGCISLGNSLAHSLCSCDATTQGWLWGHEVV